MLKSLFGAGFRGTDEQIRRFVYRFAAFRVGSHAGYQYVTFVNSNLKSFLKKGR